MRARRAESPEQQGNSSIVALLRRGLGAVGNSCIVAYGARSPTRSEAQGHAQPKQLPLQLIHKTLHRSTIKNMTRTTGA